MELCHRKSPFTPFGVFFHSQMCCPAVNSCKEWKSTLLHYRACYQLKATKVTRDLCLQADTGTHPYIGF